MRGPLTEVCNRCRLIIHLQDVACRRSNEFRLQVLG